MILKKGMIIQYNFSRHSSHLELITKITRSKVYIKYFCNNGPYPKGVADAWPIQNYVNKKGLLQPDVKIIEKYDTPLGRILYK